MAVQSTIVVEFGDDVPEDSQFVQVDLDAEVNVDSAGNEKTSFLPGEEVGFTVHFDETELQVTGIACSHGSVIGGDRVTRTVTRAIQFANTEDGVDLSHVPVVGTLAFAGIGNQPRFAPIKGRTVTALSGVPAIGSITYDMRCRAYRRTPAAGEADIDEAYQVLVVIKMDLVEG